MPQLRGITFTMEKWLHDFYGMCLHPYVSSSVHILAQTMILPVTAIFLFHRSVRTGGFLFSLSRGIRFMPGGLANMAYLDQEYLSI